MLRNSLWLKILEPFKFVKNIQEHYKTWRFSLHKINKNMQRKPVGRCFYIRGYDFAYHEFETF